jgi:hypothetical protein
MRTLCGLRGTKRNLITPAICRSKPPYVSRASHIRTGYKATNDVSQSSLLLSPSLSKGNHVEYYLLGCDDV